MCAKHRQPSLPQTAAGPHLSSLPLYVSALAPACCSFAISRRLSISAASAARRLPAAASCAAATSFWAAASCCAAASRSAFRSVASRPSSAFSVLNSLSLSRSWWFVLAVLLVVLVMVWARRKDVHFPLQHARRSATCSRRDWLPYVFKRRGYMCS
jgi:hypothetical protein